MPQNLGLMIHWFTFVLGDICILVFLYSFIIEGQTFSARETAVKVFFLLVLYGLGWAINFILTGHRSLLPWVENWEIFSERHRD
jgi:hypothetical protein